MKIILTLVKISCFTCDNDSCFRKSVAKMELYLRIQIGENCRMVSSGLLRRVALVRTDV
jgi:hypothetical protein